MPPRTNAFQQLIHLVEQLTAPAGATVEESAMLEDLTTGTRREVDVLVTVPVGPRTVRLAIECRDHARPASVTWIEQLHTKYASLPVDRVVAVSRAGFTSEATARARYLKIDTLSLAEAETHDWASAVRHFRTVHFLQQRLHMRNLELRAGVLPGEPPPQLGDDPWALPVVYPDGVGGLRRGTVRTFGEWLMAEAGTNAFLQQTIAQNEPTAALTLTAECSPGLAVLTDAVGARFGLVAATITAEWRQTPAVVPVAHATFGETSLFYGRTQIEGTSVQFAAVQREGEDARFRAVLEYEGKREQIDTTFGPPSDPPPSAAGPAAAGVESESHRPSSDATNQG